MSRCISSRGEYSEHTLPHAKSAAKGWERFTCSRCFTFDEEAALVTLDAAETRLAHMTEARDNARAEAERLTAVVKAVRALHVRQPGWEWCSECDDSNHPCATVRILDGRADA